MTISDALRNGQSAILAQSKAFERVADNVANSQTKGYLADRPTYSAKNGGGVNINPRGARQGEDRSQSSNVDIATEIVDIIEIKHAYKAALEVVKTADEMLEEVTNLKK